MKNDTRVLNHRKILEAMWGELFYEPEDSTISSNARESIRILRNALGEKIVDTLGKGAKLIFTMKNKGFTLLSPTRALAIEHELVYRHTSPSGTIVYNHEALVASSPLVDNGTTPITLRPQEGDLLKALLTENKVYIKKIVPLGYSQVLATLRKKLGDRNTSTKKAQGSVFGLIERVNGRYRLTRTRQDENGVIFHASSAQALH